MANTTPILCVIDDDESVRKALRRLFHSIGIRTEDYASAEEFLERSPEPHPACLILDVHLPGMSGLELQSRLNAEKRASPFLVISGDLDEGVREKALLQGAVDFIAKPFKEKTLLEAVARALSLPISSLSILA